MTRKGNSYTGRDLQQMLEAALGWLEKAVPDIDALNVFPVPDGDTGTNMFLTLRSTLEAAPPAKEVGPVIQGMARGALMGARGNSGVILSQFVKGLAQTMEGKAQFSGQDFAQALTEASTLAYKAISRPVEGTMLTVIRDAAQAAQGVAAHDPSLASVLEAATAAARDSVARTPALLPVLAQAGVVDAGGQGIYTILEGALRHLRGTGVTTPTPQVIPSSIPVLPRETVEEATYGYCTEFLVEGANLDPDRVRRKLEKKGDSLMVVGDNKTVRVHIHALDPGKVLSYAASQGTLHHVQIRNMDEQHRAYLELRQSRTPAPPLATVAVASGEGLARVFQSLGASAIVPGGRTMNPSTQEILRAVEAIPSQQVILLPNNPNVIPAARQAASLTQKRLEVVPTESIPQGVAALLALNYEVELDSNLQAMEEARKRVKAIEMTRAVRASRYGKLEVKKGQPIAFLDGELVDTAPSFPALLQKLLPRLGRDQGEVATVYFGADTKLAQAEELARLLRRSFPGEVEVVEGGQPHYNYIISLE